MGEIDLVQLATIAGISGVVAVLLGLLVKPVLQSWKGQEWKWYGPVLNGASVALGVLGSVAVFGAVSGWSYPNMLVAVVTGLYAALAAIGGYEAARARTPE